jgi:hypothetical protein
MRQAIEIRQLSVCTRRPLPWHARLRTWLLGHSERETLIPLEQRTHHLLRDIGLAEDVRANHLLRDETFFRR